MIVNKPLVVFDIETTGLDIIQDRIIDITLIKINPDNSQIEKNYRVNPTIKISTESSKIHGIYEEDILECKPFKNYAKEIYNFIKGCDLAGFNILKFDLPILIEEFLRCDIELSLKNIKIIDALRIYHLMEKRNLSAAYKYYCNKNLDNATLKMIESEFHLDYNEMNNLSKEFKPAKYIKESRIELTKKMILNNNSISCFES